MKPQPVSDPYTILAQETRRGVLPLAMLCMLRSQKYGYALISELAERGLEIDQGTLYPMVRRLETQGLLESSWILEGARPRRYYKISPAGEKVLEALAADWQSLNQIIQSLLGEIPGENGEKNEPH